MMMLVSIRHASMTVSSSSSSVSVRQQRWFLHPIPPPQRFVAVVAFTLQLLLIIHWNHNDGNISNHMFLTTTDAFVTTTTPFSYSKITTTTTGRDGNRGAFPPTARHGPSNGIVPWPQQQHHHYYHSLHRATKIPSSAVVDNDNSNGNTVVPATKFTILMRQISKTLSRTSWISWWSQVILTVISSIILLFAKSISSAGSSSSTGRGSFVSSGIGILISTISILWTWGNGTRLSQRLLRATMVVVADDPVMTPPPFVSSPKKKTTTTTTTTISNMIQRAITIGVVINCIGLLCNLLAAQQIIGIFAIKVFTSSTTTSRVLGTTASSLFSDTLQPLDILIIQANTNVLLSQYISLVALLSLIPNMLQKIHRYQHQDEEEDRTVTQKTTTSSTTTTTIVNDDE